jgi:hypothetical protein
VPGDAKGAVNACDPGHELATEPRRDSNPSQHRQFQHQQGLDPADVHLHNKPPRHRASKDHHKCTADAHHSGRDVLEHRLPVARDVEVRWRSQDDAQAGRDKCAGGQRGAHEMHKSSRDTGRGLGSLHASKDGVDNQKPRGAATREVHRGRQDAGREVLEASEQSRLPPSRRKRAGSPLQRSSPVERNAKPGGGASLALARYTGYGVLGVA